MENEDRMVGEYIIGRTIGEGSFGKVLIPTSFLKCSKFEFINKKR